MPYKTYKKKSRSYRRPYKKYGKKYGRKRFQRKRFIKNSTNILTQRAVLAARTLNVKLPWIKTFTTNITAAGGQSYIFQGNAIVPYTVNGQTGSNNSPGAGDSLPAGVNEYSQFYDRYFLYGSSIKIEAQNTSIATAAINANLRAVLLAIPFSNDTNDSWANVISQLNGYTYEQLLAWPYAKWKILASNQSGYSVRYFKMFRKTKFLCGLKDLKDNVGSSNTQYGGSLNDGSLSIATNGISNPQLGFIYYFKVFNLSAATAFDLNLTVKMNLYCCLKDREFNPIQQLTA